MTISIKYAQAMEINNNNDLLYVIRNSIAVQLGYCYNSIIKGRDIIWLK